MLLQQNKSNYAILDLLNEQYTAVYHTKHYALTLQDHVITCCHELRNITLFSPRMNIRIIQNKGMNQENVCSFHESYVIKQ